MQHWIDRESENDNVIVASETAILLGSCDEEVYDQVDQQLSSGKNPLEVLGTDDLTSIPYSQIQSVTSRSTDKDVSVAYKAKKEIEDKALFFDSIEGAQGFVAALDSRLPEHLVRKEFKQSAIAASLSPLISLLLSVGSIYLFIDKFRWVTLIVGGIWALASLSFLAKRVGTPPVITRWSLDGRYMRKAWGGVKTAVSYIVLAAIIAGIHDGIPDSWGARAIYDQMQNESLHADNLQSFLDQGADIDYQDENGDTALSYALDWAEYDVALALIEAGADLSIRNSYEQTPLEQARDGGNEELASAIEARTR